MRTTTPIHKICFPKIPHIYCVFFDISFHDIDEIGIFESETIGRYQTQKIYDKMKIRGFRKSDHDSSRSPHPRLFENNSFQYNQNEA